MLHAYGSHGTLYAYCCNVNILCGVLRSLHSNSNTTVPHLAAYAFTLLLHYFHVTLAGSMAAWLAPTMTTVCSLCSADGALGLVRRREASFGNASGMRSWPAVALTRRRGDRRVCLQDLPNVDEAAGGKLTKCGMVQRVDRRLRLARRGERLEARQNAR